MMSKTNTFFDSERIFFPFASIIAILVPMYTVTVIVNSYTLPPTLFPFFQWHGFEMIYTFFPTVLMGLLLKDYKQPSHLLFLFGLWPLEQILITFSQSKILVLLAITIYSISAIFLLTRTSLKKVLIILMSLIFLLRIVFSILELSNITTYRYIIYESTLILLSLLCINLELPKSKFKTLGLITLFIGIILQMLSYQFEILNYTRASLHLWAAGGLSILMLDIILKQTYDKLKIDISTSKLYKFLFYTLILGFLIRFLVPIINIDYFNKSLHHSMGFWTLAYLIYFFKFTPKLLKRVN